MSLARKPGLSAPQVLERQYLQMRERCLSLAADLDRITRAPDSAQCLENDPRLADVRQCLLILMDSQGEKASRVQMLLSDKTPPPR
jgi:hypothetical protein